MAEIFLVKFEPEKDVHGLPPPYSLLYPADALEKAGFPVRLFHERATPAALARLIKDVEDSRPLFVGFSSFTTSPMAASRKASQEIKKRGGIPVVWGGIHPTIFPEQTLENPFVDIVVAGEGEETVVELARALSRSGPGRPDLAAVRGIGFKKDGRVVINEQRPFIRDLDAYSPAWQLLDIDRYIYKQRHFYTDIGSKISGDRVFALITSRGCPWRCGYCYNQAVNRRTFRAQSPDKVLADVDALKRLGVSSLIFEDDNFFADKNRTLAIVRRLGLPWSCSIRADYIAAWGEDFVRELAENHCFELRIGAESGSQRILDLMHKDVTVEQIRRAVSLLAKYKIQTVLNFMVGIPGETWDDVRRTMNLIDDLEKVSPYVIVSSLALYAPWPGSPLSDVAAARGFKAPTTLDGWSKLWAQRMRLAPYMDRRIKFIGFYRTLIRRDFKNVPFPYLARMLKRIALWRWKARFFRFPLDYYLPASFLRLLRKVGLKKAAGAIFD